MTARVGCAGSSSSAWSSLGKRRAERGGRRACRRRWCDIQTSFRLRPGLQRHVDASRPPTRPAGPGRSEIERQGYVVRTRAVVAHGDVDLPQFGIGLAAPHARSCEARHFPRCRESRSRADCAVARPCRDRAARYVPRRRRQFRRRGGLPAPCTWRANKHRLVEVERRGPGCDAAIAASIFLRSGSKALPGWPARRRAPASRGRERAAP